MEIRTEIVDYARPCMEAERALKQLHLAMLEKDQAEAIEQGLIAVAETRKAIAAIRHELESKRETTKDVQSAIR